MNAAKLILIVDDDPDDVELFAEALTEVNPLAACISKRDGKEALDFLFNEEERLPDIIFLDLNMPKINGRQCLEEIKNSKKLSHIPVVIYSTTRQYEDENVLKRLGADNFIVKPSSFSEIRDAIINSLNQVFPNDNFIAG